MSNLKQQVEQKINEIDDVEALQNFLSQMKQFEANNPALISAKINGDPKAKNLYYQYALKLLYNIKKNELYQELHHLGIRK